MAAAKKAAEKKDPTITSESVQAVDGGKRDPDAPHVHDSESWQYEPVDRPDGGIAQVQILPGEEE